MDTPRRYRLGNQPEKYELSEKYLGWNPLGFKGWYEAITENEGFNRRSCPSPLTLVSPDGSETVSIIVHQLIVKDAFPLSFFGEARAVDWFRFAKISFEVTPGELFIIPLH